MARIINNPLGELSGKAGSVVFKKTKYGNYVSSLPNVTKKPSVLQQRQQSKMKMVMHFLTPLRWILKNTYFPLQQNSPSFNHIKSYYLRHALTPSGEGFQLVYSRCLMSYGDLRMPEQVVFQREGMYEVLLTWEPQQEQAMAQPDDQLFVVVYQPDLHQFCFVEQVAERQAGQATFELPEVWDAAAQFYIWVGYYRPEEQQASLSVYLGSL
ncbi:DUF6266 family protein [Mesonia aestuariivivens]|uniref:Uncharacterized protein n=1 Tax=Mesonia aestuariivivens TaxID=2796128 RepID=A0ABS6W421_9FLAO|nr:DUF6266 family protein [Mesonia aestuariivivens]MBW2962618.1 hypothetical protein [Mesonia aestuariivivens]